MKSYKQSTLQIGDKVKLNQKYFTEGKAYFDRSLKYPRDRKHYFIITDIWRGDSQKGRHYVEDVITFDTRGYKGWEKDWESILGKDRAQICHIFLDKIN